MASNLEEAIEIIRKQSERIEELEEIIRRLTNQPSKPKFSQENYSQSRNDKKIKKEWKKGSKNGKIVVTERKEIRGGNGQCTCGCKEFKIIRTRSRIVQGISIKLNNIEYKLIDEECIKCRKEYRANVDEIGYNKETRSLISILKYGFRMTHPLIKKFLEEQGIQISSGEISKILMENSKSLQDAYTYLRTVGIKKSKYNQTDATITRRRNTKRIKREHLQFTGNKYISTFKITDKYNIESVYHAVTKRGVNKGFVADDSTSNHIGKRQLCWVHELRHYQKLTPILRGNIRIKEEIINELRGVYHEEKTYGNNATQEKKEEIQELFRRVVNKTTGYLPIDECLKRTRKKEKELLMFLDYPYIPIHNNESENSLREAVIIRKISHETKSKIGDKSLERHLSVIQTIKKQKLNLYRTFREIIEGTFDLSLLTSLTV